MEWLLQIQDYLLWIVVPLVLVTANQVRTNWASLWDDDVTAQDRQILLRASLFLLEPLVVLCHELAHAGATLAFNGKVVEFHFAVLSGYVVPDGTFTPLQVFLIYLAGNAASILIGYLCLLASLIVRSPAVVATLVYTGLWSIGSSAVIYAVMSVAGLYGDWSAMYKFLFAPPGSPANIAAIALAVVHVCVVASLIYLLKGNRPRLWFASRTRPKWAEQYRRVRAALQEDHSLENFKSMAWLFYEASLYDMAKKMLDACALIDSSAPEPEMLYGYVFLRESDYDRCEKCFLGVTQNERSTEVLRARAYMAIAYSRTLRTTRRDDPKKAQEEAIEAYTLAAKAAPDLGDPRYLKAATLIELKRFPEAEQELSLLADKQWLDESLLGRVPAQLEIASKGQMKTD